jgi:ribosomal subunit interface protein
MEIIFKGRQTEVSTRFRDYATAKLEKLERLDQKAIRVDVEVLVERNPRQASQKERVELTITSRGPTIRAEAAAEDRFAALDLALGKLDSRLRRALGRRKSHYFGHGAEKREAERLALPDGVVLPEQGPGSPEGSRRPARSAGTGLNDGAGQDAAPTQASPALASSGAPDADGMARAGLSSDSGEAAAGSVDPAASESVVPIEMDGDGPLVVRQKFHHAAPISIDQALLEMELVGHDFYLFHDIDKGMPSVVYRRRGYQYGVIRLVEQGAQSGRTDAGAGPGAIVPGRRRPEQSGTQNGAGIRDGEATALQSR